METKPIPTAPPTTAVSYASVPRTHDEPRTARREHRQTPAFMQHQRTALPDRTEQ
ncbi:hypothetical protein [Streptomyces sp. NPDC015350]|uniref:hypothetical protein n=1 Tax=Streptomyces sp. NPDC015350 TaxID=3364955 RepID=UPI003703296F